MFIDRLSVLTSDIHLQETTGNPIETRRTDDCIQFEFLLRRFDTLRSHFGDRRRSEVDHADMRLAQGLIESALERNTLASEGM